MSKNNRDKPRCKCTKESQKRAIRRNYVIRAAKEKAEQKSVAPELSEKKRSFPDKFPFWARLKIEKKRTTLVIDEAPARDKKTKKLVDGFVHREATSTKNDDYEEIIPNPDKDRVEPMYLKRPRKLSKYLLEPHNKDLDMPEHLRQRYVKNNRKGENDDK